MYVNYNDYQQRKTTCTCYIYIKQKNCVMFLYTKGQTICKKQDNWRYVFIHRELDSLRYAIFHEISEIGFYIQKSMIICVT